MAKSYGQETKQGKMTFPLRGETYLGRFDPAVRDEIQKTRPAVVVQNNVSNRRSPITIVAAISSQFSELPFPREVIIEPEESGLPKRSAVIANPIRSVDREQLVARPGRLSASTLRRVDEARKISL